MNMHSVLTLFYFRTAYDKIHRLPSSGETK